MTSPDQRIARAPGSVATEAQGRAPTFRLVILNEFDRPETRMIALVRETDSGAEWTYLSADRRVDDSPWLNWISLSHPEDVTDVADFGLRPIIELRGASHFIRVERVAPSRATYSDGKPRDWQGDIGARSTIRPSLLKAVASLPQPTGEGQ